MFMIYCIDKKELKTKVRHARNKSGPQVIVSFIWIDDVVWGLALAENKPIKAEGREHFEWTAMVQRSLKNLFVSLGQIDNKTQSHGQSAKFVLRIAN